jgi:hypothetical protein
MIFAAHRAISLAGILVAKAGEFVAAANAVAVASFGRGFDWDEWHGFLSDNQEKHGTEKNNAQGAMSQTQPRTAAGSTRTEESGAHLLRDQSHIFQMREAER